MPDEHTESVLFPEPDTPRTGPLGRSEPGVHWYTQITRPEAIADRATINDWYRSLPDSDGTVAIRLRSELNNQHYPAVAEVIVHRLLRSRHEDVRYEEAPGAPDFRVYQDDELVLSLEVMALAQRADWTSEERQHDVIVDALDERVKGGQGYMLDIVELRVSTPPSLNALAKFVEQFLADLPPPAEVSAALEAGRPLPTTTYQAEGIFMQVAALPLRKPIEPDEEGATRIVGMGPAMGGMVNSGIRLKEALRDKGARRYDLGDCPYVVAALIHDPFCTTDQWMNALYGPDRLSLRPDDPIALALPAEVQGLYGRDPTSMDARATGTSSVLIIEQHGPLSAGGLHVFRLDNPNARVPLPDDAVPFSRRFAPVWTWTPPSEEAERPLTLD